MDHLLVTMRLKDERNNKTFTLIVAAGKTISRGEGYGVAGRIKLDYV